MRNSRLKLHDVAIPLLFVSLAFFVVDVGAQESGAGAAKGTGGKSTAKGTTAGVEVEVGIGSRIGGPQISNYTSSNGILSLTNLGRATPQFLTGLGFIPCQSDSKAPLCTNKFSPFTSNLGAFVTANFGSGSNQTISGYTIGATFALGKHLRALAGFSLSPISQVSPGFQIAASQYVAKNPTLFPGISSTNLASNAFGAFDGIQFTSTAPAAGSAATSTIYYPGSVTETHYRGGFMIGVAMPIDIFNLLGGGSK
jgi:hypothetical protein